MALKEQHQALKADSQAAFDDARRLQERWHQHTVLQQAEAYQVGHQLESLRMYH